MKRAVILFFLVSVLVSASMAIVHENTATCTVERHGNYLIGDGSCRCPCLCEWDSEGERLICGFVPPDTRPPPLYRIPNSELSLLPNIELYRLPGSELYRIPDSELHRLPNNIGRYRLPDSEPYRLPDSERYRLPDSERYRLP